MKLPEIVNAIQEEIASGIYQPGARIKTQEQLQKQFSSSSVTIQKAINCLVKESFLETRGVKGTFVTEKPPSSCRFTLMLPREIKHDTSRNSFRKAIVVEAKKAKRLGKADIKIFEGYMDWRNMKKYVKLVDDFSANRMAGVIFTIQPLDFIGTPLIDTPNVARVAITSDRQIAEVPVVFFDMSDFLSRSFCYLKNRKCKNTAFIGSSQAMLTIIDRVKSYAGACDIKLEPENIQTVSLENLDWGYHLTRLLFNQSKEKRPDGLIIADDNLVPPVTLALKDHGGDISKIPVAAHANFPMITPSHVESLRIGVRTSRIMEACLNELEAQKQDLRRDYKSRKDTYIKVEEFI